MKVNQLKAGAILSYAQMILSIVIGIIQAPILIRALGQSEYGLYNTIVSTLSMLSILSLGFNSSYIRFYSKYKQENDEEGIRRLNGAFLLIFLIIGLIALACGLFLTYNLQYVFSTGLTSAEYALAKKLMFVLTFNLAITFPMSVFQNIISAHEKFVFLKLLGMIRTVIGPLIIIPILFLGYKSLTLAIVTVLISVFVDVLYFIYVIFVLKQKFYFRNLEKTLFKDLFAFSIFLAINLIVDEINSNVDKIILSRYRGTISAAIYSVGYSLYIYYRSFSTAISGVFAPRIHNLYNKFKNNVTLDDNVKNKDSVLKKNLTEIFIKVGRSQFLLLSLIMTGFVFFGKVFIYFWAGEGYDEAYIVAMLLILPSTIPLIQNLGIEIQRAQDKHKFRSIAYLIMALINIILTIILCQPYGATGATIGTAISMVLANGFIMNIYYHKKCNINVIKFWKSILRLSLGLIIPCVFGFVVWKFITINSLIDLAVYIIAYMFIYSISMWLFGMNRYEKELILKPIKKLFKVRNVKN